MHNCDDMNTISKYRYRIVYREKKKVHSGHFDRKYGHRDCEANVERFLSDFSDPT